MKENEEIGDGTSGFRFLDIKNLSDEIIGTMIVIGSSNIQEGDETWLADSEYWYWSSSPFPANFKLIENTSKTPADASVGDFTRRASAQFGSATTTVGAGTRWQLKEGSTAWDAFLVKDGSAVRWYSKPAHLTNGAGGGWLSAANPVALQFLNQGTPSGNYQHVNG